MDIFKNAKISGKDISLSFAAIAFPIHVWAIVNLLFVLPAWLLRLSIWEMAGGIGYTLVDALVESLGLCLILVLPALFLPKKWLADKFVAISSMLGWLLAGWAILIQFIFDQIIQWRSGLVALGLILVLISFGLVYWLTKRIERISNLVTKITQRLATLSYLYIFFDLLGLVVIIIRNFQGRP